MASRTPTLFWCQTWLPVAASPPAPPYSTLAAPESATLPRSSSGTPTARSSRVSPFRSPAARAWPKRSDGSTVSRTPALFWCQIWLPVAESPPAPP